MIKALCLLSKPPVFFHHEEATVWEEEVGDVDFSVVLHSEEKLPLNVEHLQV